MKKQLLLTFFALFWGSTLLSHAQTMGCGQIFYDNGGANGNYSDSANDSTTFCPDSPNSTLIVSFNNIAIDGNDVLYVYDGDNPTAPLLATITSTSPQQMSLTSSTPGSCLTFVFNSDATGNSTGWEAYLDCIASPNCLAPVQFSSNTNNTTTVLSWIDPNQGNGPWELTVSPQSFTPNPILLTTPQYTLSGLAPGVYTATVRTMCNGAFSNYATYTFIVQGTATNCTTPNNISVGNITTTSATINWAAQSGVNGYEVLVLPCNSTTPTPNNSGTLATTNSFLSSGLNAATCYNVYVRSICSSTLTSTWSPAYAFTTLPSTTPTTGCGSTFTDPGGDSANYANNTDSTVTICPSVAGDKVTVTFTTFNTEATWDGLYVYDGNSIAATQISSTNAAGNIPGALPGAFWGTTIPGPFTSSSADGCLTFRFRSDSSVNLAGWTANVTCAPPPTCPKPTALVTSMVTSTSSTLSWTEAGSATSWEVFAVPCGSPAPTATTVGTITNSNPYVFTGLTPATCYTFYVRSLCSATDISVCTFGPTTTTLVAPLVCGGTFTDPGGPNANFANNTDSTVTICPITPGEIVTVTFTTFNTETAFDGLYVFDGSSITSPQIASTNPGGSVPGGLPGSFWGSTIPGPFTSSSADGCLTFRFRSDGSVNFSGWTANVTCAPPPTCPKPTALVTSMVTSTSLALSWTEVGSATSWEVFAVPCGSPAPNTNSIGTVTTSNPFVFSGLTPGTCYNFYVRSLCSATDISLCTFGPTVTTQTAPPVCGGNYVDNGGLNANYNNNTDETITICPTNPSEVVTVTFNSFNTEANWDALYVYDGNSTASPQIQSTNGPAYTLPNVSGGFWGTTIPGPFTSSDPSGCLTFRFKSDASVNNPGWNASVTCAPSLDRIMLVAFVDDNNNGIKDANESLFANGSFVYDQNNSGVSTSVYSPFGRYSLYDANPNNTYDFSYTIQPEYLPYYTLSATNYNDLNIPVGSGTQILYFPVTLTQTYNDVTVSIVALSPPRPGLTYTNKVVYRNIGLAATDGTLTFTKPTPTTISSISQTGTVATATGFTYAFTNLLPNESRTIYVTMSVPASPTVNLNDILTDSASISAPANDINLTNNTYSNSQIVVNSYDPNDKMESHGDKIQINQFTQNDYLYYTIRFQNNGTANAIDVRIEDILDAKLDETSIRMISSSHNYIMDRVNNNLTWDFKNIQLPPSSVDANGSMGYVFFKIKARPGFVVGDVIPNTASIYFDSNPAIVTNTFNTLFVAALANENFNSQNFLLFPNPATSFVTIKLGNTGETIGKISITDMLGKTIKEVKTSAVNEMNVDVSDVSKGIYLVEITTENGLKQNKKLVIE